MKISLITSSHFSFDERIYHHMANSLLSNGFSPQVISSLNKPQIHSNGGIKDASFHENHISKSEKIIQFIKRLKQFNPSIIICSSPLTVYAAHKYKKTNTVKIVYDITEFYPSKKHLRNHKTPTRWLHFIKYYLYNLYALKLSDAFIFGEYYKSKTPKLLFPNKKYEYISYYPKLELFKQNDPKEKINFLNLSFSGPISIEKGFLNFINVVKSINEISPKTKISIKIIGDFVKNDKLVCTKAIQEIKSKCKIEIFKFQPLSMYLELIKDTDIFMDLRSIDFENSHCLPIKLYYYIALERPIIFSNLKAISKSINIQKFGKLVDPTDSNKIAKIILIYVKNPDLYVKHCQIANQEFKSKYNWQQIENNFLDFLTSMNNGK